VTDKKQPEMMTIRNHPTLMTPREACEQSGYSRRTISRAIADRNGPKHFKFEHSVLLDRADFARWLGERGR
jgi:predicted DNA-binding transcriptional regulator AlpA